MRKENNKITLSKYFYFFIQGTQLPQIFGPSVNEWVMDWVLDSTCAGSLASTEVSHSVHYELNSDEKIYEERSNKTNRSSKNDNSPS